MEFRQNYQGLYWKCLYYKYLWIYKGNLDRSGLDYVYGVYCLWSHLKAEDALSIFLKIGKSTS